MFSIFSIDGALTRGIEYLPAAAIVPKAGMALKTEGGQLVAASGEDKPSYISLCERETALVSDEVIPVMRADDSVIFETVTEADLSAIKMGDKLTLSADGTTVTAATGGAAEVVCTEKRENGYMARVRFN